jgi:hypothetical protein
MSVLKKLTEGIVKRDLGKEGTALLSKWERTGLLEGLNNDNSRSNMARLLENQAKELLREASTMAGGDVEGFASVAFPIVRRVFGGLIANDLVSVQPMSLPSGLIFFLDFQFTPGTTTRGSSDGQASLFGGGVVGQQVTGGVSLTGSYAEAGFYSMNNGYSSPTGSTQLELDVMAMGVVGDGSKTGDPRAGAGGSAYTFTYSGYHGGGKSLTIDELVRYDPDLSGSTVVITAASSSLNWGPEDGAALSLDNLIAIEATGSSSTVKSDVDRSECRLVRRLTTIVDQDASALGLRALESEIGDSGRASVIMVWEVMSGVTVSTVKGSLEENNNASADAGSTGKSFSFPIKDNLDNVGDRALGAVVGNDTWGLENDPGIPEIDIKVDSVAITAITKKLKAKWTPELGQDLNAYHNLDAEVELTGILSEQIALEIDREIVNDLIRGATAATYYWARSPGMFVNRETGTEIGAASAAPDFTGTVSEWYETLVETINDVSAQIHRKTLRGGANFLVCSPEVANILEFTSGFRANITADADKGSVGAVNAGSISKKWDVWVDPYFPRNVVLVGRRGNSFLESGFVYAPYVPLQTTPTIFGTEDFVPRKGVMTRYGKKMVRPDMYGLVIVRGLLGEAGATS